MTGEGLPGQQELWAATAAMTGKEPPRGPMVNKCPHCIIKTQGGFDGLAAHIAVVHPGKEVPSP